MKTPAADRIDAWYMYIAGDESATRLDADIQADNGGSAEVVYLFETSTSPAWLSDDVVCIVASVSRTHDDSSYGKVVMCHDLRRASGSKTYVIHDNKLVY